MKAAVVTFPGSNGDYDLYKAAQQVGFDTHFVWHRERGLDAYDVVLLPGGFSYGDYLRAGAIARMSPIMEDVIRFAAAGGPVLGICNGFQTLCEAGLLPGALVRNDVLRFQGKDVRIRVERTDLPFTSTYTEGQILTIPIAHGEGNYEADPATLEELEGEGRVVFRYVDRNGEPGAAANPNGSWHNIAGVTNEAGNVLGMMPHPERAMEKLLGSDDGLALFASLVASVPALSS
ncbi:MAG: phosphoribosylformylglycinamidine synthase subunit PurQ [Gemmatimonadota bacterium]|nr:phosphoribosylformylglycinamidine synthase subunit PurQ [Gemmatimonadota bacterium]MDH3423493.1 phosphoribosylformylglycinamidine synthase subunit PurQ [Gemmatimonadota bacterium]